MEINGVNINDFERVDDLHRNGLQIIQDPKRFCFGVDAVLLTGFARIKKNESVLDLGTGTGIIPILLTAKCEAAHFTGLEIQSESVEMARRSVRLNNLCGRVDIHHGDIKRISELYKPSSFDVVTSNPPYIKGGSGLQNDFHPKAIARHELLLTLEDVISGAARVVKPNGRLYLIHRPFRLTDILTELRTNKLEPKQLRFVCSYAGREPTMVMIEAVRGGKPDLRALPNLVVYKDDGSYTDEINKIYYE